MKVELDVIEDREIESFKQRVNEKLKKGWELHGDMKALIYKDDILYIQAIIEHYDPYFVSI
jgi:hypothetical protein